MAEAGAIAEEALQHVAAHNIDLALMDIRIRDEQDRVDQAFNACIRKSRSLLSMHDKAEYVMQAILGRADTC